MCGIAGFCNDKLNREQVIRSMNSRMVHRGPDAEGIWLDENSGWTLGHRRLSIRDLSANGAQPMISASGRFVVSYNGEIYNAAEIRDRLEKEAHFTSFRGTSDTETLLQAIEAFGIDKALSLSKGMFAVAVYDRKEEVLYLSRDRVGEKPLYYGFIGGKGEKPFFAFASDIALFSQIPGFEKEIDRDALANFMLYNYIKAPATIYTNIKKLQPGAILELKKPFDRPEIRAYWSITEAASYGAEHRFKGSFEEASDELQRLLENAIKGQMISDVPLGAFLSGGIDSTLIVSLMQNLSSEPIKTFTIGFDDARYNEAEFAKQTADRLGTEHTVLMLSESEMKDAIPNMSYYFSEPFGDPSMIPTYFLSKLARSRVTVSLSGDAGDELFCGYEGYWKTRALWDKEKKIPSPLRKLGGGMISLFDGLNNSDLYRAGKCLQSDNVCQAKDVIFNRKNNFAENIVLGGAATRLGDIEQLLSEPLSAMGLHDMRDYHPDDILVKVDRAGMAASLENRIPMLDKDVLEFSFTLPPEYKYKDGVSKRILRNILYKYVPKEQMERPKQGFNVPLERWLLEGETKNWAKDLVYNCSLANDGYIDDKTVLKVWKEFENNSRQTRLVWNILVAEAWYRSIRV